MPDYLPRYPQGHAITLTASAPITGGRLVVPTGDHLCATAGDNAGNVIGVAAFDVEAGEQVTVYTRAGGVHGLVSADTIAAGARVCSASAGRIRTAGGSDSPIGLALTAAGMGGRPEVRF